MSATAYTDDVRYAAVPLVDSRVCTCSGHHALQGLPSLGEHSCVEALPSGEQHAPQGCQICLLDGGVRKLSIVDKVCGQLVHSHAHARQLTQVLSCTLPYLPSLQHPKHIRLLFAVVRNRFGSFYCMQ